MARILLVGATGVFGSRLAAHLAREPKLQLMLGSRSLGRAQALCDRLSERSETRAALKPVAIDVKRDAGQLIAELAPRLVVDCSGPFQDADYRLAEAALRAQAHFIDLADAPGYILGFSAALDALARERGLTALTGASSSPALSVAVVAELTAGWRRIDHVAAAIVPGGRSETGEAAIRASISYCGRPVPVVAERQLDHEIGWSGGARIAVAGLGRRSVAPVETADAELLAALYPQAVGIRFVAGLESPFEQQGMRILSALRKLGLKAEALAPLLPHARRLTRLLTGDKGGMVVRASGLDGDGRWREASWTLLASRNEGPHVPPAPAAAAVKAILAGREPPGARVCLGLPLSAIAREFAPYAIETRIDSRGAAGSVLEAAIGKEAVRRLPPVVASFHAPEGEALWAGEADVEGAANALGRLVARAVGFPDTTSRVPVAVVVERDSPGDGQPPHETWTRRFGSRRFRSRFTLRAGSEAWEQFGPLHFRIGLRLDEAGRLTYPVMAWHAAGVPMPMMLAPRSDSVEWQDEEGRFRFDVSVSLPLVGRLVRYRGWLMPSPAPTT